MCEEGIYRISVYKIKGLGQETNSLKNLIFTLCPCADGFEILCCKVEEKINIKIVLALMKTLTNSKNCFGSRIIIFLPAFLIRRFSPVSTHHWMQEKSTLMSKMVQNLGGFRYDISKLQTVSCKQFYN